MKVLVTGGAGFIGSHIVNKLIDRDYDVVVVDNMSTGTTERINPKAAFYNFDIASTNLEHVMEFEKPDFVIHHAAQIDVQSSLQDPLFDAHTNILGTINLLVQCRKLGVKKFVYASSAAAYGDPAYLGVDEDHPIEPISFYGISKFAPEYYIKTFSKLSAMKYTILRYSNVYGIGQDPKGEGGVVSFFIDRMIQGETQVVYGDGEQTRDFIYVSDVADANVNALLHGNNTICNISSNKQITINELLEMLNLIAGTELEPMYLADRKGDIRHSYLDNSRAIRELQWKPRYSLISGLKETYRYYSSKKEAPSLVATP
jgi:UDP-glucose 4-epimerase